jgi:hypothetical protein
VSEQYDREVVVGSSVKVEEAKGNVSKVLISKHSLRRFLRTDFPLKAAAGSLFQPCHDLISRISALRSQAENVELQNKKTQNSRRFKIIWYKQCQSF